jgi:hypothetical protein
VAEFRIDIDGNDESARISAATIRRVGGERRTLSLEMEGDPPAADVEVLAYAKDGTTPIFGGLVASRPQVVGVAPNSLDSLVAVDVVDWSVYGDWCSISLSYDAPVALEDVLEDIKNAELGAYGVTYTPVATGVVLEGFTVEDIVVTDLLRQLRDRAMRDIVFLPNKAMVVRAPGWQAAPQSVLDSSTWFSRLDWRDEGSQRANSVKARFGPTGTLPTSQVWIADGSETSWVTDIPAVAAPVLVEVDNGVAPYLATVGPGGMFEFDVATSTLSVGTDPTPANGTILRIGTSPNFPTAEFYYEGRYPFTVVRPETPPALKREYRPPPFQDVTEYGPAVEITEQLLASLDRDVARVLTIETDEDGFDAWQSLTVNTTRRGGIVESFLIGSVTIELVTSEYWRTTIEATEALLRQATRQDRWRGLVGTGGSGSVGGVVVGGGSGSGTVLSSPVYLGGSDGDGLDVSSYTRVLHGVPFVAAGSFSGRVRCELWCRASGAGVTARLRNVTDSTDAGTSSEVVSQAATATDFLATILAGKTYQLEIARTSGAGGVYCGWGTLEAA